MEIVAKKMKQNEILMRDIPKDADFNWRDSDYGREGKRRIFTCDKCGTDFFQVTWPVFLTRNEEKYKERIKKELLKTFKKHIFLGKCKEILRQKKISEIQMEEASRISAEEAAIRAKEQLRIRRLNERMIQGIRYLKVKKR